MRTGKGNQQLRCKRQGGFSFIEISVVMIVIGILITAVTLGRNVMRTAEMTSIFTNGVSQWSKSIYIYYERYGRIPGDTGATCNDNASCSNLLANAGLTAGFDGGAARVGYTSAQGVAGFVQLTSVVPAGDKRTAVVTLEDTLGRQGLIAVQGLVNGSTPTTTAPYTMTYTLSQFSAHY
ncbi:MAG: type II secretion system protein [Magnetococcales bacterium]|nr:type II secretion system protein [Magnetococcales bacterium]NGZ27417.1 type II secretion system protein [Magnetococcales bacterium]